QFLTYDEKTVSDNISYLKEFSQDTGKKLNILLVPGASYGERGFLPFGAANVKEKDLIAEIGAELADQNFIDITDRMGPRENNYFRTDHHWNENGAAIGYDAICRSVLNKEAGSFRLTEVSDSFRGTMYSKSGAFWTKPDRIYRMDPEKPLTVSVEYDNGNTSDSLFVDENLSVKDQYTYYLDGNHGYVHIKTDAGSGKKAILIKDSYSHILIPYLAAEYSDLEIFDLRYFHDQVSTHLTDKENTDVYVIYGIETFCTDTNLAILW
ncbi:MAG: DHHW family protein, partial [Erysipelotrichaceae bacterium]|nr:DHHW family protein [Erysipelotrichaceae bacterium]